MGTTDTPDTPVQATRVLATDKILAMSGATSRGTQIPADYITPVTGKGRYCCLEGNLGALGSLGTSATATANATYVSPVFVRHPMLIATGKAGLSTRGGRSALPIFFEEMQMALTVNHPTLKEVVVPTTTVVDSSAAVSMFARAPFRGKIVKWGVINTGVVDSDRVFTAKGQRHGRNRHADRCGVRLGSGRQQLSVPTAGNTVNEDDKLEIASDGAGSTASVTAGFFVIQVA
jgi:hypothetical protein